MTLTAPLAEAELRSLISALLPLRVDLRSSPADEPRWLEVADIVDFELVPGDGYVATARVRLHRPKHAHAPAPDFHYRVELGGASAADHDDKETDEYERDPEALDLVIPPKARGLSGSRSGP